MPMLLSMSLSAVAAEPVDAQLNKCIAALDAKKQEASLCGLGVQLHKDELSRVTAENTRLRQQQDAWYRSPWLWAAIGSIVGVYAGARAAR